MPSLKGKPLTPRELQVLKLIVRGMTSREAAEALSLSSKTVDIHRDRINEKLDVRNAVELVLRVYGIRRGAAFKLSSVVQTPSGK